MSNPSSPQGLAQIVRMQGIEWGDGAGHDYHLWWDGNNLWCDGQLVVAVVTGGDAFAGSGANGATAQVTGGKGDGGGTGGSATIRGGNGGATGAGGQANALGGNAGSGSGANGGDVVLSAGNGDGVGNHGRVLGGAGSDVITNNGSPVTSSTAGFLCVPISAGPPSGTPVNAALGVQLAFDTTNHRLYFYENSAWHYVARTA